MSTPSTAPLMTLSRSELSAILKKWCPTPRGHGVVLRDNVYQLCDDTKVAKFMSQLSLQVQNLLLEWKAERRDCDKYSGLFASIAKLSHALVTGPAAGLALGELDYIPDGHRPDDGHAINLVVTRIPGQHEMRVRCYDPQTGVEVGLTPNEKASIELILL